MQEPKISPDQSKTLAATKYVKLYDLAYQLPPTEVGGLQLVSVVQANSPRGVLP